MRGPVTHDPTPVAEHGAKAERSEYFFPILSFVFFVSLKNKLKLFTKKFTDLPFFLRFSNLSSKTTCHRYPMKDKWISPVRASLIYTVIYRTYVRIKKIIVTLNRKHCLNRIKISRNQTCRVHRHGESFVGFLRNFQ